MSWLIVLCSITKLRTQMSTNVMWHLIGNNPSDRNNVIIIQITHCFCICCIRLWIVFINFVTVKIENSQPWTRHLMMSDLNWTFYGWDILTLDYFRSVPEIHPKMFNCYMLSPHSPPPIMTGGDLPTLSVALVVGKYGLKLEYSEWRVNILGWVEDGNSTILGLYLIERWKFDHYV